MPVTSTFRRLKQEDGKFLSLPGPHRETASKQARPKLYKDERDFKNHHELTGHGEWELTDKAGRALSDTGLPHPQANCLSFQVMLHVGVTLWPQCS